MKKAGILAAGEGLRIKPIAQFKPIVKIYGIPLLEITYKNLQFKNFERVVVIFNEDERKMDLSILPCLSLSNTHHFYKSTPSSLHSLYEVVKNLDIKSNEHFFISMVDSIVLPSDAQKFQLFCQNLKCDESAILVTQHIDDESPLTLKINNHGNVTEFQCQRETDSMITSGVYCFSENTIPLIAKMIDGGQTKMRTFLTELIKNNYKIKTYLTKKTLDIDRPEDIESAQLFLQEYFQ